MTDTDTRTNSTPTSGLDSLRHDLHPDLTRCAAKSPSGRQCKLTGEHPVQGTTDGHVYAFRGTLPTPKHITEVTPKGFSLTMEAIPVTEDLSITRERTAEPRDEYQVKVDADATGAYKKWEKAGKPVDEFAKVAPKCGGRYIVPPAAFDTVIGMLRRTVQTGGPLNGKALAYRRTKHASGNTAINFLITDKPAKDEPKK